MPVYNGEKYLAEAIESVLNQTFQEFELIISDNCSNDATDQICLKYARIDARIRYYRSDVNRGAAWNHNRLVHLARGEFFKWQCYDDLCAPEFLAKCLAVLESDPGAVLCYPRFIRMDAGGRQLGVKSSRVKGTASPHERFYSLIHRRDSCEEIYGLMRACALRKTGLIGSYSNSDDTFLAELILQGTFREVPEPLFLYRLHVAQSTRVNRSERMAWFNSAAAGRISLPFVNLFLAYLGLVWRAPIGRWECLRCYGHLAGWFWRFRWWLSEDVTHARMRIFHGMMVPFFRRYFPWTRPVWHALKPGVDWLCSLRKRLGAQRRATESSWYPGEDRPAAGEREGTSTILSESASGHFPGGNLETVSRARSHELRS